MWVRMLDTLATTGECYRMKGIYEVPDAIGASWVRGKIAVRSEEPPGHLAAFLKRLSEGSGRPCLFLPPAGVEFGHECMMCIRFVHFHGATHKVVCCRPGTEVLYPSADVHFTKWTDPIPDSERCGTFRDRTPLQWPALLARFPKHFAVSVSGFTASQEMHAIKPEIRIPFRPKRRRLSVDVALGVRVRGFAPLRNWPRENWMRVAEALRAAGLTFAVVGTREQSYDLPGQKFHTGDYDTDAAIETLQNCKLFVGSCSGAAHLASAVGARMLVFRYEDSNRKFIDRMEATNPGRVTFTPEGWDNVDAVARPAVMLAQATQVERAVLT
jgi:hypothetical protein